MMNFRSIDGLGVTIIAAVAGLLYIAGVRPLQTAYADTVRLKADLWLADGKLAERRVSEKKAAAIASDLSDRLEALNIELSNIDQMNTRLAALTQLAEQSGLAIEAVRPGVQTSDERYRAVMLTLVARAGYAKAGGFLDRLRDQFPDTGLQSIAYDRLPEGDRNGRLQIVMVWYAAPEVSAGSAGRSAGGASETRN